MEPQAIEAELRGAIGQRQVVEDFVAPSLVERLAVTLDCQAPAPHTGEALPAGWHTIFCLKAPPRSALNDDGLPRSYELIPPVPMQRRMFGGARIEFHQSLVVGEPVRCESELSDVKLRSGPRAHLAIATLRYRFFGKNGLAVVEEQDIIHMEPIPGGEKKAAADGNAAAAQTAAPAPTWQRTIAPDTITLFRFSALTFNSHRIHYDAPYSEGVEKLPGLVVQGKLIALHLLETVRRAAPDAVFENFSYRSESPLYAGGSCTLAAKLEGQGDEIRLWAADAAGHEVQTASLKLAQPMRG
jgi:3-methylfumaryl-CoA hydratase